MWSLTAADRKLPPNLVKDQRSRSEPLCFPSESRLDRIGQRALDTDSARSGHL